LESWRLHKRLFASFAAAPLLWLILFFLIPLGIVWLYSFGETASSTEVALSGTLSNYAKALDPLYLKIFGKSVAIAALTTALCLVIGFPVALAIVFAPERWRGWLLMLVMLPFLCSDRCAADPRDGQRGLREFLERAIVAEDAPWTCAAGFVRTA
jgi:spermidine/putrescine transport system permease protein